MEIEVVNFKSKPRETPFAPEWNYVIGETYIDKVDFKKVSQLILKKEKQILKLPYNVRNNEVSDGYTELGKDSLTSRFGKYNVLNWNDKEIKKIKKSILNFHNKFLKIFNLNLPDQLYIRCWANVMRKGEQIKAHIHDITPHTYLGGHICVQVKNTCTNYINPINQINEPEIYNSKNTVGKLSIFQNCIPHYTDIVNSNKERITIAFDLSIHKNKDNDWIKLI